LAIFKVGKQLQLKRLRIMAGLLLVALVLLALRLVDLQVVRHAELRVRALQNTVKRMQIPARRGDILDARGNLLASSTLVKHVCADPTLLGNYQADVARTLAPILQLSEAELQQKLQPRFYVKDGKTNAYRYVRLKADVPVETWAQVQQAMTNLTIRGVDVSALPKPERTAIYNLKHFAIQTEPEDGQVRVYPHGALAAHVLGFVGRDGDTNSASYDQLIGADGIERTFNDKLGGINGWRITEKDSKGREVVALRDQNVPARDGYNVVLTIDTVVQNYLELALAAALTKHRAANVTGIVLRPATGEILAMASLPDFDPNRVPRDPELRRNRLIGDVCEPGSTFKIVPIAGALHDGKVRLTDLIDCQNGTFSYGGRVLRDAHGGLGLLSVEGVVTKSSNVGAAKIALKMGEQRLYEHLNNFGFGWPTGIQLPAESRGIVHPVKKWSKISIVQIPMGHGVAVTRLQMAMAMAAMANEGWLMRPMLVSRLEDQAGNVVTQYQPQRVRQVVSETAAAQMVQALKTVVETGGTGTKAALTNYTVAGKSGTAQKPGPGGYQAGKYISSFIGFLPADRPEICISIVIDEPDPKTGYYGGSVAGPVFREVATSVAGYLQIQPDRPAPTSEVVVARSSGNSSTRTQ
jgi:cell division protein FtsI/penicillin-binding protein 2